MCTRERQVPLPEALRVLLADDLSLNTKLLSRRLGRLLVHPAFTFATTGEEALELLAHHVYDLVILDEIFGNDNEGALTGTQVTRAIRAKGIQSGLGGALPIIGSTVNEAEGHNERAMEAGQMAVWGKPLPADDRMACDLRRAFFG